MKIKEVDRTANVVWSPKSIHPIYLATGTAAQQLDATFSTSANLELYELNLQEPGLDMVCKGNLTTDLRFHRLVWGGVPTESVDNSSGIIVGGCDGGRIFAYDPAKIISGDGDPLVFERDKHTGPVRALDFNPFQSNLLGSGAGESEILIWDLNNPNSPMTPGAKSQPADDVTWIAWNRQVQHILATTFSTRCVVWDLRKNEPIIKVSGSTSRMRCKVVSWHPEVATQMCLASEDDQTPFIQLWDLRFATSPVKTMESHQRGVLSLSWCAQDSDLLLSCGKDCRILCWNPNSNNIGGEIVCEIPTSNQWSFDVAWCPRNPALISSCSFDGHVSVYSMMGGQQQIRPSSKVAEAFSSATNSTYQTPDVCQTALTTIPSIVLKNPPNWLRRPVGASFGFGGKLVTFDYFQPSTSSSDAQPKIVYVSQVVTEPELVNRAVHLERILAGGHYLEFCEMKIANSNTTESREIWSFLQANFDSNPKSKLLSLLGHDAADAQVAQNEDVDTVEGGQENSAENAFDVIAKSVKTNDANWDLDAPFVISKSGDTEGTIAQLLLCGKLEAAVDLCLKENHVVEAILLGIAGGNSLLERAQNKYFKMNSKNSLTRLVAAVVAGNWRQLVSSCNLDSWKEALAGCLVYADPEELPFLCEILGDRLENDRSKDWSLETMLCYICAGNTSNVVKCWSKGVKNSSDPLALQELVEQLTILNSTSRKNGIQTGGTNQALAEKLCLYSNYLATQGSLSTALMHLQSSTDDNEDVIVLKDRLNRALGNTQARPTWNSYFIADNKAQIHNALPNQRQQFPIRTQPRSRGASFTEDAFLQSNARSSATPPAPINSQPATTARVGHLNQRYPSHISDASVYGGPTAPVYPSHFGPLEQQPNYGIISQPTVPYSAYGTTQPAGNMSSFNYPSYDTQQQQMYNPTPSQMPADGMNPLIPTYPGDLKPGWNDPPLLSKPPTKPKQEFEAPAPITHPLYGVQEPDPSYVAPYVPPNQYPQDYGANFYQPPQPQVQQQVEQLQPVRAVQQEQPKPKGPIPSEHQILYDIFEDLKNNCLNHSNNMQIRRKLEDVSKKLEVLYDKLRADELTANTILGLHQIVQVVQQKDYVTALHIHTQIITTGAFSEISGFMPGLKVLLQLCSQLGVYLQ